MDHQMTNDSRFLPATILLEDPGFNIIPPLLHPVEVAERLDVYQVVEVCGKIIHSFGLPAKNISMEIWHATKWSLYGMEYGPSFAPVDAAAQGWQLVKTDENGCFSFQIEKKLLPPTYLFAALNLKMTDASGHISLSKLYIDEDILDPDDPFLMDMEIEERSEYIGMEINGVCVFDLMIP